MTDQLDTLAIRARELRLDSLRRSVSAANLLANYTNRAGARIGIALIDPGAKSDAFTFDVDGDTLAEVIDLLLHRLTNNVIEEMKALSLLQKEATHA